MGDGFAGVDAAGVAVAECEVVLLGIRVGDLECDVGTGCDVDGVGDKSHALDVDLEDGGVFADRGLRGVGGAERERESYDEGDEEGDEPPGK